MGFGVAGRLDSAEATDGGRPSMESSVSTST